MKSIMPEPDDEKIAQFLKRLEPDYKLAVEAFGTDEFADVLVSQMDKEQSKLPLDGACEDGGWWEEVVLEYKNSDEDSGVITATVVADFYEYSRTGCPDKPRKDRRRTVIYVEIDRETGCRRFESEVSGSVNGDYM